MQLRMLWIVQESMVCGFGVYGLGCENMGLWFEFWGVGIWNCGLGIWDYGWVDGLPEARSSEHSAICSTDGPAGATNDMAV